MEGEKQSVQGEKWCVKYENTSSCFWGWWWGEELGLFRQSWSRVSASPCAPAQGELWEGESEPGLAPVPVPRVLYTIRDP